MTDLLRDFDPALRSARGAAELSALAGELHRAPQVAVIVGSSIPGLALAALLGTTPWLRTVLVTGPPPIPRRLLNGCSLRRATLAILGRTFGCGPARLFERLGGARASFTELRVLRVGAGVQETRLAWRSLTPIGLSTRHGAILSALRAELRGDVTLVPAEVPADARLEDGALPLSTADGPARLRLPPGRHVILNATPLATLLRPGRALPAPARVVVAVQAPMRPAGRVRYPGDVAIVPSLDGPRPPHLGFFTPFADPDNPGASWYGINTRIVDAAAPHDQAVAAVRQGLLDMAGELGLEQAGGDDALGEAVMDVVEDDARASQARLDDGQPIVDAGRAFAPGAPAINVDGMLSGARGAEAFARAFLEERAAAPIAAVRALAAVDAALAPVRMRNRANAWFFFGAPPVLRRLTLSAVPRAGARAFTEDFADLGA